MFFYHIVCRYYRNHPQISQHVFEHCQLLVFTFINSGQTSSLKQKSIDWITRHIFRLYNLLDQKMFSGMFWVKYLFRVMHIGALVVSCQAIISAKMSGQVPQEHKMVYMMAGIFVIVSGIVNTFILKPKEMGEKRKLWVGYNHLKALTAIVIFTPLAKFLPISLQCRIDVQFYWMILVLVLSPFARFYREHFVALEKERKGNKINQEKSA